MTLHSKAHFPALAALRDPPNVVLLTQVSRKGSRNKTLLQLCKTTFLKQFFFPKTSLTITQGYKAPRESRSFCFNLLPFVVFSTQIRHEIQPRDLRLNQYALHCVPQISKDFLKNTIGSTIFIIILIIFNFMLDFNIRPFSIFLANNRIWSAAILN